MDLTFEQARERDMATILQWRLDTLREVFNQPELSQDSKIMKENYKWFERALIKQSVYFCVVRSGDETVGCGCFCRQRELPSLDNPNGTCGYLMNIYIRPENRGQGLGTKLVEHLIDQCRMEDIHKIYLESTKGALKLYESLGFTPMVDYLIYKGN